MVKVGAKWKAALLLGLWFGLLVSSPVRAEETAVVLGVVGDDVAAYTGSGTPADPYRYLFDVDSKVTWKHLRDLKANKDTEIYEKRWDNIVDGRLEYSWKFSHDSITSPEGPYFLGINFYDGDAVQGLKGGKDAKYFSFANKRDLPGTADITLYVGQEFQDHTFLGLYYYGGYQSDIVHGSTPVTDPQEIKVQDKVKQIAGKIEVMDGYVKFQIRYGGNYYLKEQHKSAPSSGKISKDPAEPPLYADEKVLGTIKELFPTKAIAEAIADGLMKHTRDEITQADLDSIKSIFLSGMKLKSLEELGRYSFARLEQLILSDNQISKLPGLSMPMLTYLDLSNNRMEDMKGLAKCRNLEVLLLPNNKLQDYRALSDLPLLISIDLSGNDITKWYETASETLRYLNLSDNKLTKIGKVDGMKQLEVMDLSRNPMVDAIDTLAYGDIEIITDQIQQETIQKDTIQKDTIQKDTTQKDTTQQDTTQQEKSQQKEEPQVQISKEGIWQEDLQQKQMLQKEAQQDESTKNHSLFGVFAVGGVLVVIIMMIIYYERRCIHYENQREESDQRDSTKD